MSCLGFVIWSKQLTRSEVLSSKPWALTYGHRGEMRFVEFVMLVVDVQHRFASETHHSRSVIVGGHPETASFDVRLKYLALLCPEGRIFRWLSFDTL